MLTSLNLLITDINIKYDKVERETYTELFWKVDSLMNFYSKLIKLYKISIGNETPKVKNPKKIFSDFGLVLNEELHYNVLRIRNTYEHFEERIQLFDNKLENFAKFTYHDLYTNWTLTFGSGGFSFNCNLKANKVANVDLKNFDYCSWIIENKNIVSVKLPLIDIWHDVIEIKSLVYKNIVKKNKEAGNIGPSGIGAISIFIEP